MFLISQTLVWNQCKYLVKNSDTEVDKFVILISFYNFTQINYILILIKTYV
jgi:hypothetical protein